MKKTRETKNKEAQERVALKRNPQDQIRHLDEKGFRATKERARLNKS